MNKVLKRLKSRGGETLVESMAAILIFTFGSIIMLSMVTAAADINKAAKEADAKHRDQMATVEKGDGAGTQGVIVFTYGSAGNAKTESADVRVYSLEEDGLYAYYPVAPVSDEGGNAG